MKQVTISLTAILLTGCAQIIGIEDLPEVPPDASTVAPPDAASPPIDARTSPDADLSDWWDPTFPVRTRITMADPPTERV